MSPNSKATSTSSSGSGRSIHPPFCPMPSLHHAAPVRDVVVRQPREGDTYSPLRVRVVVVDADRRHDAVDARRRRRARVAAAERRQSEDRSLLPPADDEVGEVGRVRVVLVEDVTRVGHDPLAGEVAGDVVDLHGDARLHERVPFAGAFGLGEGRRDVLSDAFRHAVGLARGVQGRGRRWRTRRR